MSYYDLEHSVKARQADFERFVEQTALQNQVRGEKPHRPMLKLDVNVVGLEFEVVLRRKPVKALA